MRSRYRPHAPREITGQSFAGDGTARRRAFLVSCQVDRNAGPKGTSQVFLRGRAFKQGALLCRRFQLWLCCLLRVSFRHSVPSPRAAQAPAVHQQASEHRPGPRDLEYGATAGPSNPGQRQTQPQPEATISALPKRIRYRQQMRFQRTRRAIRNSRALKCSRLTDQVRAGGKALGSTDCSSVTPPSSSTR